MPRFTIHSNLLDTSVNKYLTRELIAEFIKNTWPSYKGRNYGQSKMYTNPEVFISAANKAGINAAFFICHGGNESAGGLSDFALNRNNFWGYMAFDSNPNAAKTFSSLQGGVDFMANFMKSAYFSPSGFAWKMAVSRGKKPPTIDSMAGIWWTSTTQANTIVTLRVPFIIAACASVFCEAEPR